MATMAACGWLPPVLGDVDVGAGYARSSDRV